MLAVKWIYERDGISIEHVYEAESVTTAFDNKTPPVVPGQPAPVRPPVQIWGREIGKAVSIIDGWNTMGRSFNCGKIYVMQGGKTVASYDLGPVESHFDEPAVTHYDKKAA